MTKEG
jgi:hypothetical protein